MRADFAARAIIPALCLVLVISTVPSPLAALGDHGIPPTWDIVADDFERGTLDGWEKVSSDDLRLAPGSGHNRSTGLSVTVGEHASLLRQTGVARAEEGYVSFWLNPNKVNIPDQGTSWTPGKSICVAAVRGTGQWHALVALWVRKPGGQGYKAYLAWNADDGSRYDFGAGEFDLIDGWQEITLGFEVDNWVAAWLNDVKVRQVMGVTHDEARGEIIEMGKANTNTSVTPSGELRFDDVAFQVPRITDLWVSAASGNDEYDGLSPAAAFRSIQKAADLAGPGTKVHILPGVYRETVRPTLSGSATEPAVYRAENGPGTAIIRGSEPAGSLAWSRLATNSIGLPPDVNPGNLYYADLSSWALDGSPRFVVQLDDSGQTVTRLPLAREPDWQVATEWKYHESWWAADGGSAAAACDPASSQDSDCDISSRSTTQLTDRSSDGVSAGIEPGNLTTLGHLAGATLVAMDTISGHYVYRRKIVAHDVAAGKITVDRPCEFDSGSGKAGLGWGSKYYVESHPALIDTPGEWWYDAANSRLYLWPPLPTNPATQNIETSRRDNGFNLKNRSYVTLDGLAFEFFNQSAIQQANWITEKSYGNTVRNVAIRYANRGVFINQEWRLGQSPGNLTDGFTLEDSVITYIDTYAIRLLDQWDNNSAADSFTRSGINNTLIRNNEFHHVGFRSDADNADGLVFTAANRLRFESNNVHNMAHNGLAFAGSVIQSRKTYGFAPSEIRTGDILILNNTMERACELATDCGALKFWGYPPDNHVYRDVLVTGNVFRNTFGWSYISEQRRRWSGGPSSDVRGMGGFGLYVDTASGVHVYRNIAYNNAYSGFFLSDLWWDGDIVYYNNVAANSLYGISLGGYAPDNRGSTNTQIVGNIVVNNEGYGILLSEAGSDYGNLLDHNLYYGNGWRRAEYGGVYKPGDMALYRGPNPHQYYQTLAQIQAGTPWEDHGVEADPGFLSYDVGDHDIYDRSAPDFHTTPASTGVLDRGPTSLPGSLARLLLLFGVPDARLGNAFDIGRYEAAGVIASPTVQVVRPGDTTAFILSSYPPSFPAPLSLTASCPDSHLSCSLASPVLNTGQTVTLTVMDAHDPGMRLGWPAWYAISVSATYAGGTQSGNVRLLVGGVRVYLPSLLR